MFHCKLYHVKQFLTGIYSNIPGQVIWSLRDSIKRFSLIISNLEVHPCIEINCAVFFSSLFSSRAIKYHVVDYNSCLFRFVLICLILLSAVQRDYILKFVFNARTHNYISFSHTFFNIVSPSENSLLFFATVWAITKLVSIVASCSLVCCMNTLCYLDNSESILQLFFFLASIIKLAPYLGLFNSEVF